MSMYIYIYVYIHIYIYAKQYENVNEHDLHMCDQLLYQARNVTTQLLSLLMP